MLGQRRRRWANVKTTLVHNGVLGYGCKLLALRAADPPSDKG